MSFVLPLLALLAIGYYAVMVEPFHPEHTVVEVAFPGLPAAFDGWRILHVSDVHASRVGYREVWLGDLLERTRPELLMLTGDLVSGPRGIEPILSVLARARPTRGAFAVWGNNEIEELPEGHALEAGLRRQGFQILSNEHRVIEEAGEVLVVAGVDDPNNRRDDVARALTGAPAGRVVILLSHTPETFPESCHRGVALQLSGHTHGGQVQVPGVGPLWADTPRTGLRYTSGLYRKGEATLIVSRGLGWSILPVRLFCRPQIVEVRLRRAQQSA